MCRGGRTATYAKSEVRSGPTVSRDHSGTRLMRSGQCTRGRATRSTAVYPNAVQSTSSPLKVMGEKKRGGRRGDGEGEE